MKKLLSIGMFISVAALALTLYSEKSRVDCSGGEFDLQLKKVYPKIVTPSFGAQDNNYVIFEFSDPQYENARLRIFSVEGRNVSEIDSSQRIARSGTLDWYLKWDCRDSGGSTVNPGIYVYQFEGRNKIFTGTIV